MKIVRPYAQTTVVTGIIFSMFSLFVQPVFAVMPAQRSAEDPTDAFASVKQVILAPLTVPTVVELPLGDEVDAKFPFALVESGTKLYIPYRLEVTYQKYPVSYTVDAPATVYDQYLNDGDTFTSAEFPIEGSVTGTAILTFTYAEPIESSAFTMDLAEYVALPETIRIDTKENGTYRTILAPTSLTGTVVRFPKTLAQEWVVTLTYTQPLRIEETAFTQDTVEQGMSKSLRFLAQPGESYMLYHNADRYVTVSTIEVGDLVTDAGVLKLGIAASVPNARYRQADVDSDSVPDTRDNCPHTPNRDQTDQDQNRIGDACDDYDRDGFISLQDNCPMQVNRDQADKDADGLGDTCDPTDNRFTEQYKWIPWAGMGIAVIVLCALFVLVAKVPPKRHELS